MPRFPTNSTSASAPSPAPRWERRALAGFVVAPLLGMAALVAWVLSVADRLPDPVAVHFGAHGEADGFGGLAGIVVILVVVSLPIILIMGLLGSRLRNPRIIRRILGPASPVFAGFMCGLLPDTLVPQLDLASAVGVTSGSLWTVAGTTLGLVVGVVTAMALTDPPAPVATDAPDPSLPRGPRVEPIRVEASTGVKLLIAAWFAGTLASLLISPALFLLLALSSFYIVQMHSVRVRVDDAGVHLRMLLGETIPLETITAARPARYDWGDSGGVGIRGVGYRGSRGKRIAVAARSGEALDVDTTGHNWTIVVPDGAAERIAGDINARLDARPGPRP